jgi:hypothetical protein
MQPGREAVLSSPSNPEVKNSWDFTSTSSFAFLAWFLIKYGVNLVFWFYLRREREREKLLTITDSPVSGADECARDLRKKYCDMVEELSSHEFIKEPFMPNYYYYFFFFNNYYYYYYKESGQICTS